MPRPYSLDLRERVVRFVEEGHSRRAAAAHFQVSVSFVVNLVAFRRRGPGWPSPAAAGAATPSSMRTGRFCSGAGRREGRHHDAGIGGRGSPPRPARRPIPPRFRVGLFSAGYRFKNSAGRARSSRRQTGARGMDERAPARRCGEPQRLVFLDETGTTAKMTSAQPQPQGPTACLKAPSDIGRHRPSSPACAHGALTAPFVIDAPMNRLIFETYVETQLAPALKPGDGVVILDNLPAHKKRGRRKDHPRTGGLGSCSCRPTAPTSTRSGDGLRQTQKLFCAPGPSGPSTPSGAPSEKSAISSGPEECQNYFAAAGYGFT